MNYTILGALICTVLGIVPLVIRQRFAAAAILGCVSFFFLWWILYWATPSTIWPLLGWFGFMTAFVWLACAFVDGAYEDDITWVAWFPTGYVILLFFTGIYGWSAFNAPHYATLIGPVEERVWTPDVQPKDPHHIRMVNPDNAFAIATKTVGQAGTIGSQFHLDRDHMTLQRVNKRFIYAAPFDYNGYSVWLNTPGSPGFTIVDGEDTEKMPRFVRLPAGKEMKYMPGAYFSFNLERHLRTHGFLHDAFAQFRFKLDDNEKPWWIVTIYRPTISWYGQKITGIVLVDPITGVISRRYTIEEAPEFVDRIVPEDIVESYVEWRGTFSGGWWNSWWGKLNLTKPEKPILIYGADETTEWVTGITSHTDTDDSLVGLMYTNSRTGTNVYYKVNGGATDTAIMNAINKNSQVQFRHLHATRPQIYNIYGTLSAISPLLNNDNLYQGIAIVAVQNVQDVAVGTTQTEAIHAYEALVFRRNQQANLENNRNITELTGVVDRIRPEPGINGVLYYFHITGTPHMFVGSGQEFIKLILTNPDDEITVTYVGAAENVLPIQSFDNKSLLLKK